MREFQKKVEEFIKQWEDELITETECLFAIAQATHKRIQESKKQAIENLLSYL